MFWRTKVLSGKGRKCEYCGTEIDGDFEEGETPKCPNCGSLLQKSVTVTVHDKDRDVEPVEEDSSEEDGKAIEGSLKYIEIVVGIVLAIILIIALIEGLSN
jgi:DNA-directed RNA polymerase subunit RPC12/RpoP